MLGTGHWSHSAFIMKSSSFFPFVVLLALGILASWAVEGVKKDAIKIGACPSKRPAKCLRPLKPLCDSDWQCPGTQRCCQDSCGFKCTKPLPIPRPVRRKSGKCPTFPGRCLMLNPPNMCDRDGECEGKYKCCPGMCGRICILPQ